MLYRLSPLILRHFEGKQYPFRDYLFQFGWVVKICHKKFHKIYKFLRPIQTEIKNPKRILFALEMTQNNWTKSI